MQPKEIRLIGAEGKLIGVIPYEEALLKAKEANLDLVLISEKANPPVYKLGNYSKIKYEQEKKLKAQKLKERKNTNKYIRIGFNEGDHDLIIKAEKGKKFLEEGKILVIELPLRGREKAHQDIAKSKLEKFLTFIQISYKIIQPITKSPRGLIITIKKN
ncbi:MAG: translation initiation factor IF-3 [Minisyncoccia bacterium]